MGAKVLRATIEAGGDTDTIASIAGQVGGAAVGESGGIRKLVEAIDGGKEAIHVAEQFAKFVRSDTLNSETTRSAQC